ncbi:MAG: sugar ABC transporter permease [Actinomycetota bacterium]|nr:sugar ABC transporter permease [Actinomycetota bacterium]
MATAVDDRPVTEPAASAPTPKRRPRRRGRAFPYLLLAPTLTVLGFMLGYPLYRLGVFSLQEYGLPQVFGQPAPWVGLDNYRRVLGDSYFWTVLWRTLAFCFVNVALTMVLGVALALLMAALGRPLRLMVSASLILAWAMPPLSATVVWQWIFDTQYGLVNWLLDTPGHAWLADQLTFYLVATIIVVWMGVPFVAITTYAGLTQIPDSLHEAAAIDGASGRQRLTSLTLPMLKPILLVLTSLSVLWDFRVFTQIYVLQKAGGISRDTNLLGVYAYNVSIGESRFDVGAAVAIVMVLISVGLSLLYLRGLIAQEGEL